MEYKVVTTKNLDFSLAQLAPINQYRWAEGYEPVTNARVIFVEGVGLALRIECLEENPKTTYYNFYDPVYKDSCVEMFVSFDGEHYINLEMNSYGASRTGFGGMRPNRGRIDKYIEPPKVKAGKIEGGWYVEAIFTIEDMKKLYPNFEFKKGATFTGNFFKCGDETDIPHYGMWSVVESEEPNFHRPDFFGNFVII